jgi:hypothetical protein
VTVNQQTTLKREQLTANDPNGVSSRELNFALSTEVGRSPAPKIYASSHESKEDAPQLQRVQRTARIPTQSAQENPGAL